MSDTLTSLKRAFATVQPVAFKLTLARVVPLKDLQSITPHQWLFITGRRYRYNLAGVNCIYFSETREVAQIEYDAYWAGVPGYHQPIVTYHAAVSIADVLDLEDSAVLNALGVKRNDLFLGWRTATAPTLTQLIGTAVHETGRFSAIRYPSAAAEGIGKAGSNFAIFKDHLRKTDSVRILDHAGKAIQEWP